MLRWAVVIAMLAGCDRVLAFETVSGPPPDAEVVSDAFACHGPQIGPGDFSAQTAVFGNAVSPSLTADQTLMYVSTNGSLSYATNAGTWSAPMPVPSLGSADSYDDRPSLSYDARHIFFTRHPTSGGYDQPYEATRTDAITQTWGPVTAVAFPPVLAGNDVAFGIPSADGRLVVASHGILSHYHLTELVLAGNTWALTDNTTALYRAGDDVSDSSPQLSPDGCWLVFARLDHAIEDGHEIMIAARGIDGTFGAPQFLFTNMSTQDEQHPWLSPDGNTLYYFDGPSTIVFVATRAL